jgi:hypothetical protein
MPLLAYLIIVLFAIISYITGAQVGYNKCLKDNGLKIKFKNH